MEPGYSQLMALFAAWREEIDAVPFAHEAAWSEVVGDLPRQRTVYGPLDTGW